jgi:uncharacterized peroxidase-related enzyme
MPRLSVIDPEIAEGKAKTLLDAVKGALGSVPNMTRGMARSPAVLEGYLAFSKALAGGALDAKLRERIALATAEANGCDYCLAAHSFIGRRVGLSEGDIAAARDGAAADPRAAAALGFVRRLVAARGAAADDDIAGLRAAGFVDGEIGEIVANVALNLLTNYFNMVAQTDIDFPAAAPRPARAA